MATHPQLVAHTAGRGSSRAARAWAGVVALSRRRAVRIVFAVAVLIAAMLLLRVQLRGVSVGAIWADLRTVPPLAILGAVVATAASYVCLAGLEAWALATVGKPLSAGRVLLVSFVAYALSNGLGFSVATSGAARMRLYPRWGLGTRDIGAVSLLSGAAVSAAGLVTAGLALLLTPGAPPIAVLLLAPIALWAAPLTVVRRLVRRGALAPVSPAARASALGAGLLDWVFASLALFLLLPDASVANFAPFLAIFVLGSIVSGLTGVPGGIGVFDAIVLVLSKRFALPHETAAALLLYRLIYAVAPLVLVALGFAVQTLRALGRPAAMQTAPGPDPADWRPADAEAINRACRVIAATKTVSCDAFLVLMADKALVFSPGDRSFVMYRPRGRRWVAMSGPVGPADDRAAAIGAFAAAAAAAGARPVFYAVEATSATELIAAGLRLFKIGESAAVPLPGFSLKGPARADLRHALNVARRAGLRFSILPADDPKTPWADLAKVSTAWLAAHAGSEKGFSLGRFERAYLRNFPIAILAGPTGVAAFANVIATPDGQRLSVDLMRCRPDAAHGAMDALFAELLMWGKAQGYRTFELGMAPLAGLAGVSASSLETRVERWIYGRAEALYPFQGLRAWKAKFEPDWRPMYLAAPPGVRPLSALADVALLTSGGRKALLRRPVAPRGRLPRASAASIAVKA